MGLFDILEYIVIAIVLGVISYYIWTAEDGGVIKRGDEWDQ
jgi:hypothetical protein